MTDGAGKALVTLLSAWNEADSDARAAILDEALGASFIYEDPHAPAPFEGKDGMEDYLDIFQARLPDATLSPTEAPSVTHGTAMIHARLDRGGIPFAHLIFVAQMGQDGLSRVTGFVETA